jgi:hypothetical protein
LLFRLNTLTLVVVVAIVVVGTTLVGGAFGRYLRERGDGLGEPFGVVQGALEAQVIERQLWALAGDATNASPSANATRLYVETLNQMIDERTKRVAALTNAACHLRPRSTSPRIHHRSVHGAGRPTHFDGPAALGPRAGPAAAVTFRRRRRARGVDISMSVGA